MSEPAPQPGERLFRGQLYRRIANTIEHYDYQGGRPGKLAFRPSRDPNSGVSETGISTDLASMVTKEQARSGHVGYGLCTIDVETLVTELARMRAEPKLRFQEDVAISFSPSKKDGPAHVYIDPVPPIVQKALRRVVKVVVPPGPPVAGRRQHDPFDNR